MIYKHRSGWATQKIGIDFKGITKILKIYTTQQRYHRPISKHFVVHIFAQTRLKGTKKIKSCKLFSKYQGITVSGDGWQVQFILPQYNHLPGFVLRYGQYDEAVALPGSGHLLPEPGFKFFQVAVFQVAEINRAIDAVKAKFQDFMAQFSAQSVAFYVVTKEDHGAMRARSFWVNRPANW